MSGGSSTSETPQTGENQTPITVSFGEVDSSASIEYSGNTKEEITGDSELFKGEKVIVKEGSVVLKTPQWSTITLNKIAELKYLEDGNYALFSSDAWFDLKSDTKVSMLYANVEAPAGTIIALTQNEAASTAYVISGSAKVTNLSGVSTLIIAGQKVSISSQNSRKDDIDLSTEKSSIDSYFKGSDWFLENNGHILLQEGIKETTTPEDSQEETISGSTGKFVSFDNLSDEMSTGKSSLDLTGNIESDNISSITINNKQVSISSDKKTFSLGGLGLGSGVNDIVVKIYDGNKDIVEKKVYTVYSTGNGTSSQATSSTPTTTNPKGVTTYEVDATEFAFTQPSVSGKFSTTSGEVTIRGKTTADGISRVEVNGFKLSSFNGSTWRYHAFERFETLEEGTNQYKVDYFGENGQVVYTDYFTIVKKTATATPSTEEKTISGEASISG